MTPSRKNTQPTQKSKKPSIPEATQSMLMSTEPTTSWYGKGTRKARLPSPENITPQHVANCLGRPILGIGSRWTAVSIAILPNSENLAPPSNLNTKSIARAYPMYLAQNR
mmetsp:Transcript_45721/g.110787  ORF Transcript_45721/g.110787 Transcript_45721/m.110787 type:complete len:110 (-) Transcript_45721:952-1281(-)